MGGRDAPIAPPGDEPGGLVGRDAPIAPRRIGAIRPTSAGFAPTIRQSPLGAHELDAEGVGAACGRDLQVPDARHEQRAARCAVRLLPQPKSHPRGSHFQTRRGFRSGSPGVPPLDPRGSRPQTPGDPDPKPPGIQTLNPRGARLRASSGPRSVPLSVSLSCSVFLSCFCLLRRAGGSPPYRCFAHPW